MGRTDRKSKKVQGVVEFLRTDVWRIRASRLPRRKSFWIRQLRIILLALRGFGEDKCQLRASALTFYTLLSIVPVVAMAFGVAKGFGLERLLEAQLLARMPGQEEVVQQIIGFARNLLDNTRGGVIAGIGVALLFWTVVKVLGNIESSFNDIWGIKKGRSLARKFSDYISFMLICPIALIASGSLTVLISSRVAALVERFALLGFLGPVILRLLTFLPFVLLWGVFTFVYMFMPNTRVRLRAGLTAGVVAGSIYQVMQWFYIAFQIGLSKYNAIYGSFAALPLFLTWLQISWLVVLFGAEISFAEQNVETYEFEPDCLKASRAMKKRLAVWITQVCVRRFVEGAPPPTAEEISRDLEIPIRLVHELAYDLVEVGILAEVRRGEETALHPARDVGDLRIVTVLEALDGKGIAELPVASTREIARIQACLKTLEASMASMPENALLKDL